METDAKTGSGVKQFSLTVREALKDQIARWREKGQVGRPIRAMVVGVPNVGYNIPCLLIYIDSAQLQ